LLEDIDLVQSTKSQTDNVAWYHVADDLRSSTDKYSHKVEKSIVISCSSLDTTLLPKSIELGAAIVTFHGVTSTSTFNSSACTENKLIENILIVAISLVKIPFFIVKKIRK
jgi:hypothetical protein